MASDRERISKLETHITYIKDGIDRIDHKVDDLVGFKLKILGGASVVAATVAWLTALMVH